MSRKLIPVSLAVLSGTALAWVAACSSTNNNGDAGGGGSSSSSGAGNSSSSGAGNSSGGTASSSSSSSGGAGSSSGSGGGSSGAGGTFVKIDDMETIGQDGGSTNGPIELTGFPTGQFAGYWYDGVSPGDPKNTLTPATTAFTYSLLPAPHPTMAGVNSTHGAHVACAIWDQYGFCQQAFEFAQVNSSDAGSADAATMRTTVAFDISAYTGITFWVMAGPNMTTGLRVLFPDIDSDPRGNRCGGDAGQCYDSWSYAIPASMVTSTWTQITIPYAPNDGLLMPQNFGFEAPHFDPAHVYGIGFQVSGPQVKDAGAAVNADYWVDDIYFTK